MKKLILGLATASLFSAIPAMASTKIELGTQTQGVLPAAQGGTGTSSSTGTGALVLQTSPSITNPTLTGTVTIPTATADSNTTVAASTAFVQTNTGTSSIATTGGTTTLTAAQAGSESIVVTGTLSSNATLIFGSGSASYFNRTYIISNTTTGAFTVTLQACTTSPGTTITLNAGELAFTYINGANVKVANAAAGSDTQVQFNNAGVRAGDSGLTYTIGTKTLTANNVVVSAGTTTVAPIKMTAGTNLTTPTAGALEYDGTVFYNTPVASSRSVINGEQFMLLQAGYTGVSQTGTQKMFNTTTNGALTLSTGQYQFETNFLFTGMSTTTGTFGWGLTGTAVFTMNATSMAAKAAYDSASTPYINATRGSVNGATDQMPNLTASTTIATGYAWIRGELNVTTAGTIIPSFNLTVASAAGVNKGSFFRIWPVGSTAVTNVGNTN